MQVFKLAGENLQVLLVLTTSQSLPVSPLGLDILRFEIFFEEKENVEIFFLKRSLQKQAANLFSVVLLLEISSSSGVTSSFLLVGPQPISTDINVKLKT